MHWAMTVLSTVIAQCISGFAGRRPILHIRLPVVTCRPAFQPALPWVTMDYEQLLSVALEEARLGLAEGGIPIGACLCDAQGRVLGRGHNRRVQQDDRSVHGETDAFRNAGRV